MVDFLEQDLGGIEMTVLTVGTPEEAGMAPGRIAALKERAPDWIDGSRMRSGVLLVARRGKIVFHEAYGPLTEKSDSSPLHKDSIFSVTSCSKPVTATAIMMLVEDGRLGLNRPVTEYIPSLNGEGIENVEVQHLLTHTSGFQDDAVNVIFEAQMEEVRRNGVEVPSGQYPILAQALACHTDSAPTWQPGTRMDYCNFGYLLLGEVVRVASGQTLDLFANDNIFGPLGMVDSTYVLDKSKLDRWVRRGDGAVAGTVAGDPEAGMEGGVMQETPHGAAGVNTTAMDLAIFAQMVLNKGRYGGRRYLSVPAVHEMTRNQILGLEAEMMGRSIEASWGLGWMIQSNNRWRWSNGTLTPTGCFGHTGIGGHYFWIDPVNDIVGVYLSVCNERDLVRNEHHWNVELFMNMVTAAALD